MSDHHYHHHHVHGTNDKNRGLGGALRMRDKQAYYGLILVIVAVLGFGAYKLVMLFADELRQIPNGDPTEELSVDALGIRKAEEADAIHFADSLAHQYNVDSIRRSVKGDEHNVYRPPRKKDNTLIDEREAKDIWRNLQHWFKANGGDPEFIAGIVLFCLGIFSLIGFGIYKHKHRNR